MSEIDNNPFAEPANENPFNVSDLCCVYVGPTASDGLKQQLTRKTCRVCVGWDLLPLSGLPLASDRMSVKEATNQ